MLETLLSWTALPNLHPAVVHFPIAFLPLALGFEAAGLLLRAQDWLRHAAAATFAAAGATAFFAYEAGESAADSLVGVPAEVQPHLALHSDWGHYAFWSLGALALLRLGLAWLERRGPRPLLRALALVLGLAALGVVVRAADLGGGLVFEHGVGVSRHETGGHGHGDEAAAPPPAEPGEPAASRLVEQDGGGLRWTPLRGDADALGEVLKPAPGAAADAVRAVEAADEGEGLVVEVSGETLLVLEGSFGDVQVEARLELLDFEGTVGLAHHVGASDRGLFTLTTAGEARLVAVRGGEAKELDAGSTELGDGPLELAVSAAGRHLKGLLGGRTVVHGHVPPPADGAAGLLLEGRGRLRILEMRVVPL